jgi:hypothetical protein
LRLPSVQREGWATFFDQPKTSFAVIIQALEKEQLYGFALMTNAMLYGRVSVRFVQNILSPGDGS